MQAPEKAARPCGTRARQQGIECVTGYRARRVAQALPTWFLEAERISREFRRTGNPKYLRAFCRQISGMMAEVEASLPP
jgi:hypothetical protein